MSRPATERDRGKQTRVGGSATASTPPPRTKPAPEETLIATFNSLADELVSTLSFILGNVDDAHDIAQDAFLRCWKAVDSLKEVQNIRAWIFRVAINAARDLQRSAWRRRVKPMLGGELMPMVDPSPSPEVALEEKEAVQQVRAALVHLRPEEKEVFLLRQNGELTYEEIAELQDRPVGTVKTQMRSALQKLRKIMTPPVPCPTKP
jgi:RNA polymerase sigma-70 factor (ECF subfamily)